VNSKTLYWYDYETFGSDPRRDRAAQFAGIRTDENLEIVSDPLVLYCKPVDDFLPSPQACLITGITPQVALQKGLTEAAFIRRIHDEFARPGTCVAGYNSIRFDDELTRQLLYRNFYDPYSREYRDGNSRWDIIDMLRLCAAVRPDGIEWPTGEGGRIVFKLEQLTAANGISHAEAHDARADVLATIEMARLVRRSQPRLYDYVYKLRYKKNVEQHLDLHHRKPIVHVSSMYPASQGCLALVAPLCRHPVDSNGVVVYDLREDPEHWLTASPEEIRRRVFTRAEDLPEGSRRIPLKTLHVNRCPIVAPLSILPEQKAADYQIDLDACNRHWQKLMEIADLSVRLRKALEPERAEAEADPDYMIYSGGFFSDGDRKLMDVVRESTPEQLIMLNLPFRDRRLPEMLFRYRARNFPETLDEQEQQRWQVFRQSRLGERQWQLFEQSMNEAELDTSGAESQRVLADLRSYAAQIRPSPDPSS
jgi:exodeoxyribonuclease-1